VSEPRPLPDLVPAAVRGVNWRRCGLLVAGLVVLSILPLWLAPVVPTTDGPAHLYNAWLLLHLDDPALHARDLVTVNPLVPNWGSSGPLVPLLLVLSPATAEKVYLAVIVALLVTGAALLARRVGGDPVLVGAAAAILAHGWILAAGFTGFLAAFGLGLVVCAAGAPLLDPDRAEAGRVRWVALALAFGLLFFVHLAGAVISGAIWVLLAAGRWRDGLPIRRATARAALPLVVLLGLVALHLGGGGARAQPEFRPGPAPGLGRLLQLPTGFYWEAYSPSDRPVGATLVLLGLGLIAIRATRGRERRPPAPGAARALALGGGLALLAFVLVPWAAGGGAFLTDRLVPVILLLPLPWATAAGLPARGLFRVAFVLLLVGALAQRSAQYRLWGRVVSAVVERSRDLPEERLLVQAPLPPMPMAVDPLHHVWGRVGIERRSMALDNYEAELVGWFPLSFRPEALALADEWHARGQIPPGAVVLRVE
jgi:hypothetical protein